MYDATLDSRQTKLFSIAKDTTTLLQIFSSKLELRSEVRLERGGGEVVTATLTRSNGYHSRMRIFLSGRRAELIATTERSLMPYRSVPATEILALIERTIAQCIGGSDI